MNPHSRNRRVRRELDELLREGVIDATLHGQLSERYPTRGWDWRSLGRWFLIFGAISVIAGLGILGRKWFDFTLTKLALIQAIAMLGSFGGAQWIKRAYPALAWSATSVELLGGLGLIGLTFTLGVIFSTGSGNWPALLLIDLLLLLALSYALRNAPAVSIKRHRVFLLVWRFYRLCLWLGRLLVRHGLSVAVPDGGGGDHRYCGDPPAERKRRTRAISRFFQSLALQRAVFRGNGAVVAVTVW
jgi:uncharacterized membrane protein